MASASLQTAYDLGVAWSEAATALSPRPQAPVPLAPGDRLLLLEVANGCGALRARLRNRRTAARDAVLRGLRRGRADADLRDALGTAEALLWAVASVPERRADPWTAGQLEVVRGFLADGGLEVLRTVALAGAPAGAPPVL